MATTLVQVMGTLRDEHNFSVRIESEGRSASYRNTNIVYMGESLFYFFKAGKQVGECRSSDRSEIAQAFMNAING